MHNKSKYQLPSPGTVLMVAVSSIAIMVGLAKGSFGIGGRDMAQAPAIEFNKAQSGNVERAMFAGGCFWGTQYSFQQLPGVTKTLVGYTGGHTKNPTYEAVCSHTTGQAETVYVEFDPKKLSYKQLVDYFFTIHDPTTVDRQGFDMGDQYRSEIFYTSEAQKKIAEDEKKGNQSRFHSPIVTLIEPATTFYPAEEYHQNYDIKHGASCGVPKLGK